MFRLKNILIICFCSLLFCCNKDDTEPKETSNIIFYDGFETNSFQWQTHTANQENIAYSSAQNPRKGNQSLHFKVYKSDPWVANGPRSEIFRPTPIDYYWTEGDEIWIGASIFFPTDYLDDPMQEIVWQIHSGNNVPFLIQSVNNNLLIKGKGIDDVSLPKNKGEWMDIVTHHKWETNNKGITQVYVDRQLVINEMNITNINTDEELYVKFGIYKSGWKPPGDTLSNTTERELWFDEIRIGNEQSSYQEVSPN